MPPIHLSRILEVPKGWRSSEAASFLAQLEFLSARRFADLAGCTAAELAWQPGAGANTIGMLLAHNEIVEVYWLLIATRKWKPDAIKKVLGIGMDDDGMPLPARGRAPAALRGRTLAWYRRLHLKARTFATRELRAMKPADLERVFEHKRANGEVVRINARWIVFHVLEHEAGHNAQMLVLRHQYRDRRRK